MFTLHHRGYLGIVLAAVGLMALAGCNSSSSQAASASSATPTGVTAIIAGAAPVSCVGAYTSATNNYRITCPTGWTVATASALPNGVVLASPNNTDGLVIAPGNGAMTASQDVPYLQNYLTGIGATNVNVTQNNQPVTAGANTWTTTTATFTKNGTNYTIAQYATTHNGKTTFVEAVAPTATFTATQSTFQSALASLNFT